MAVEQELKEMIVAQYGSVRAFSQKTDIPYSTLDSIFKRGLGNSSVSNVLRICKELNIDADALGEGLIVKKPRPQPIAAAAHFDLEKLTDEGKRQYEDFVNYLVDKFSKE